MGPNVIAFLHKITKMVPLHLPLRNGASQPDLLVSQGQHFPVVPMGPTGFLPFMEKNSFFSLRPVDIFEKGLNIISSFETIIDHKSMLKDVHNQDGHPTGRMTRIMFIDPEVDEVSC
jgi:hypothetical protein